MGEAFALVICLSWPLLFCWGLYSLYSQVSLRKQLAKYKAYTADTEHRLVEIVAQYEMFRAHTRQRLDEYEAFRADTEQKMRDEWLKTIPGITYHNEIEVEVKFIGPLLGFLGYTHKDFRVRVPVSIQFGHERSIKQADWVIYRNGQPFVVIEAKVPEQDLDVATRAQARSYAFYLNAPLYVLTNGHKIAVYRLGLQNDTCIIQCLTSDLTRQWAKLEETIGVNAVL